MSSAATNRRGLAANLNIDRYGGKTMWCSYATASSSFVVVNVTVTPKTWSLAGAFAALSVAKLPLA